MENTTNSTQPLTPEEMKLQESWKNLTDQQLYSEMGRYYQQGDPESIKKAEQLRDFLENKKSPEKVKTKHESFWNAYNEVSKDLKEIDEDYDKQIKALQKELENFKGSKKEKEKKEVDMQVAIANLEKEREAKKNKNLQDFFKKDMKNYISQVGWNIDTLKKVKDDEINELKANLTGIVTHGPKLKEYLSWSRRRLVTIQSKIKEMKGSEDPANYSEDYPKNVLIYLMGLTNTSLFWTRQTLKRGKVKMLWKWKSDTIWEQLAILKEKIKIDEKDSTWTIGLKNLIAEELLEAQKKYVDQQKRNVGLAA